MLGRLVNRFVRHRLPVYQDGPSDSYPFQTPFSIADLGEPPSGVGKEAGKECCGVELDANPILIAGVTPNMRA